MKNKYKIKNYSAENTNSLYLTERIIQIKNINFIS